jgi:hypothetical protein
MNTITKSENLEEVLATLPPQRRAEIEKHAGELAMDKDFRRAAELLEKSQALEDVKFYGELGWLTALSIAIAVIAV